MTFSSKTITYISVSLFFCISFLMPMYVQADRMWSCAGNESNCESLQFMQQTIAPANQTSSPVTSTSVSASSPVDSFLNFSPSAISSNAADKILYESTMPPRAHTRDNTNTFSFNGKGRFSQDSNFIFYNRDRAESGGPPAPFSATLGLNLADGLEVTATGSQYPLKIKPITLMPGAGSRSGDKVTYTVSPGVQIIYTFKINGVEEDIVFDHSIAVPLDIAFHLELDAMLEARLDAKGNVLIYGPNSVLSGFIQTGDEKSAERILKARQHAAKNNLLYIIPAPVVIDGIGIKHKNIAHYTLDKSILILHTAGFAHLPAPVSIDPSIVVTTTADFMTGNNEGMITFDVDAISRAVPSGGSIANWTATTSFPTARYYYASVAYNGYLYVIGGVSVSGILNDVQFAPINANGTIGAWSATTSFPTARSGHRSVVYNGYLYVIGGRSETTYLNDVQFAPINANGTIGAWSATTNFLTARYYHTTVAYNGYLYIIGGSDGWVYLNDVQFAPINANGTVGTWTATTSFTSARAWHTSVIYNSYLYVIGGGNGSTAYNDVQFAPINANGTVGAWIETTSFTTARAHHTSVVYNGYLYVIGGLNSSSNIFNDVQFAPINANGTVGTWTATTSFTTARYGHTSVVYYGYLYVIGGWNGSTAYNDVQFAPINANGVVGAWSATTSFPTARHYHTSVAYNGYMYVIGGYAYASGWLNDVRFAPVNANGTVGAWTATTSFPTAREAHVSVAYNGYLYVIGGNNGSLLNDVQFAPINADGTVGVWTATTSFATGRALFTSVVYNGYMYIIGGSGPTGFLNDVQFALINSDGTIGTWTATTSFTTARREHTSVVYSGYLYVIGGFNGSYLNDVQFAPINADGTLGAWSSTTSFPTARGSHTSIAYNGYLYVIGGYNGSTWLNDVQFAPINANGTVGTWSSTTSFPTVRGCHTSVANNGFLYVIGGFNGSDLNDVRFAPINANGTVSAWMATTSFSLERYGHTSVAYNGYLYVIGGYISGSYRNDVQFAPINADGTVGAWTATANFATARCYHTSVAYNGYLYIIGGESTSAYLNDVQFAPINANGTVGVWSATASFSTERYYHTSVAYNGYLYVIGGASYSSTYFNDVQFAPINANGMIGAWNATTSFPSARHSHTSVVYKGYLYVIGGHGSANLNDVQFAPINADGTVGTWTATTSFTAGRQNHTSVVYNGYLYMIGGVGASGYLNDVQFAPINANGTIGAWSATTSFPTARYGHTSVGYNGYLYVIGGSNGVYFNDVQFATLQGPACRAAYSKLIDIGFDMLVQSIQFSNSIGLGITNLAYAVAPSATAVFGPRTMIPGALPSLPYTTGLNICGRYVWVRFDLDDTLSATVDGAGLNGRSDILDFTINYNPCCYAPSGLTNNTAVDADSCADAGVRITWTQDPTDWGDNNSGTRTYDVLRNGSTIASGLAYGTTSFVDTTGINGQTYTYAVRYNNGCSLSFSTAPGAQATDNYDITPCPDIGNSLFVVKSGADAVISWTAVVCADLANYRVYGSMSYSAPFPSAWTILGNPTSTSLNDPLSSGYIAYKTISIDICGNTGQQTWAKTFGGSGDDYAESIQQTSDGEYIVSGETTSFGVGGDLWVLKLNASGEIIWQKTYGGEYYEENATSIQQTSDGGYIVAGNTYSFGAGDIDYWILKLDSSGNVIWQKTYGGSGLDLAISIQQTSDGGYIVLGRTESFGAGSRDIWILKLDSSGDVLWQKTYGGTGSDVSISLRHTSDGGYIVAGVTNSFGAGGNDSWILKLDSSGNVTWQKTYGGSGGDAASSIQQTSDGGYIVAGQTNSYGAGGYDYWVLKLDSSGNVTWQKTYGGSNYDSAYSIQQTIDGGYIVAGYTNSFGAGGYDYWILKLDSSGNVTWQKTYGGNGSDYNYFESIRQTSDGGYIVAAWTDSFGAGGYDSWVLKLDANGDIDPSCTFINSTSVLPSNSSATIADTSATISTTSITGTNTSATPADSVAIDTLICKQGGVGPGH